MSSRWPPIRRRRVRLDRLQLDQRGRPVLRAPRGSRCESRQDDARLAVVGAATAERLQEKGSSRISCPRSSRARARRGILRAVLARRADDAPGRCAVQFLIPRALKGREILPEALHDMGCHVDVVPVYRTVPATPDPRSSSGCEDQRSRCRHLHQSLHGQQLRCGACDSGCRRRDVPARDAQGEHRTGDDPGSAGAGHQTSRSRRRSRRPGSREAIEEYFAMSSMASASDAFCGRWAGERSCLRLTKSVTLGRLWCALSRMRTWHGACWDTARYMGMWLSWESAAFATQRSAVRIRSSPPNQYLSGRPVTTGRLDCYEAAVRSFVGRERTRRHRRVDRADEYCERRRRRQTVPALRGRGGGFTCPSRLHSKPASRSGSTSTATSSTSSAS